MNKQRMNITTIAEILVDELGKMERTAQRIEKAVEKPLTVDLKAFREEVAHQERILASQTKALEQMNRKLENSVIIPKSQSYWLLGIMFFLMLLVGFLTYDNIHQRGKAKEYEKLARGWHEKYKEVVEE